MLAPRRVLLYKVALVLRLLEAFILVVAVDQDITAAAAVAQIILPAKAAAAELVS
jgi:hypothetical protein